MKLKFDLSIIKNYLISFLNKVDTPSQLYLRVFLLSLIIIIPCIFITVTRVFTYYGYKKMVIEESGNVEDSKLKLKLYDFSKISEKPMDEKNNKINLIDVNFLSDIGRIAEETGNEIISIKPMPKRTILMGDNIEIFPFNVELSGTFESLVNFLEHIKKYDKMSGVEAINLQVSKTNYPFLDGSFSICFFPFLKDRIVEAESLVENEQKMKIDNDPFKPFYFEEAEIDLLKTKKRAGNIVLTGIVKEKQLWAIIEVGGKSYILKNRDSIGTDIKIMNITNDSVYLIKKGSIIKLRIQSND